MVMRTAIHTLQIEIMSQPANDKFGRPVKEGCSEWKTLCKCRCDDNSTIEFRSDNGSVYRPDYHIVCEGNVKIEPGVHIRCLNSDGSVRGEGYVYRPKQLNFLPYTELWA